MKRLNKTHIFHIFFGLLMFLPFISILSRVIYVQSNKNAKDSYSGNYEITYKYESNQVNSLDDLIQGNIYEFNLTGRNIEDILYNDEWICFNLVTDLVIDDRDTFIIDDAYDTQFGKFSALTTIELSRTNNISYFTIFSSADDFYNYDQIIRYEYTGDFIRNCVIQLIEHNLDGLRDNTIYSYTDYNEIESVNLTGTLDNAFDYSISKFIEDNNFRINFFSWFEDLFLVQNGGVNALYLSFANWYMCYALLVSTGYLLFLILMWFINYVRKILEGGNSFGHGGF